MAQVEGKRSNGETLGGVPKRMPRRERRKKRRWKEEQHGPRPT